jgi:REP element-mobilizing transposase RayT
MPHERRAPFRKGVGHVTVRVIRGLPSLRKRRVVRAIEASFREGCERPDFRLAHYSIQRNHLHLIVEADDEASLGRGCAGCSSAWPAQRTACGNERVR